MTADTVIRSMTLSDAIAATIEQLRAATTEYESASRALAQAECEAAESEHLHRLNEVAVRADLLAKGLVGKNETERNAFLAAALQEDEHITHSRIKAKAWGDRRRAVASRYSIADQAQKSLRAQLAALTALCVLQS